VKGRERGGHGSRRVALHQDPFGLLGFQDLVEGSQHAGRERARRLVGPHQIQVDVGVDLEEAQDLIQHLAMLSRRAEPHREALGLRPKPADHRRHLDRLGTCSDDEQNSLCRHEFLLIDRGGRTGPLPDRSHLAKV
jgi:hypothetical protein